MVTVGNVTSSGRLSSAGARPTTCLAWRPAPPPDPPTPMQHGGQGGPGMCVPDSLSRSRLPAWLIALLIVGTVVAVSGGRGRDACGGLLAWSSGRPAQHSTAQ